MSNSIIEFCNFSWKYTDTDFNALKDVSFQINKGEFVGIMGQNGAGKTTLCRCINGLIPHRFRGTMTGSIILDGQYDTFDTPINKLCQMVGLVSSDPDAQFLRGTVEEEIVFAAENAGIPVDEIGERLETILQRVNLDKSYLTRPPTNLSGGQKQRVAIAAALIVNPMIMVLDEPTSQVDPMGKAEVIEVLEKLRKEQDVTILLVEHRSDEILKYADRVLLIDDGKVLLNEPPRQFFQNVDLLLEKGVYPPQVAQFAKLIFEDPDFARFGLKSNEFPLTVEDGIAFIHNLVNGENK
ncbi:MAG: ATP-binding cassette domain-containing protein [Bacillota bacterium]